MAIHTLDALPPAVETRTPLFAVSGFGAYTILRPGLHVLESPNDWKLFDRVKAPVVVVG